MTIYLHERVSMAYLDLMLVQLAHLPGSCIDIGLGKKDFYCERFALLGCEPVYAIDPLFSSEFAGLMHMPYMKHVEVVCAAISDSDGTAMMSRGRHDNDDLASIEPAWWGADTQKDTVQVETKHLLSLEPAVEPIKCLKIDVEGHEWPIIRSLADLKAPPLILQFEFGGDSPKASGLNGWVPERMNNLKQSIEMLKSLDYVRYITVPSNIELSKSGWLTERTTVDHMISDLAIFGNLILVHASVSWCSPWKVTRA